MPIYLYQHPKTEEVKEIMQGMNDEHVYSEKGIKWHRIFTKPQAAIDTKMDPFSQQQFVEKTGKNNGTLGDVWARSADLSAARAEKAGGVDPVKQKHYDAYSKIRKGKLHPQQVKEKLAALEITI